MEQNNEAEQELSGTEVLTLVCKWPIRAFEYINDTGYDKHMKLLISLAGLTAMIKPETIEQLEYSMSFIAAIIFALVMGFVAIWISAFLTSSVISLTGGWLGGEGGTIPIMRVLAYVYIPAIINNILQIIFLPFLEEDYRTFLSIPLDIAFGIWGIALLFIAIREVQQFSSFKTILNMILSIIIMAIVIVFFSYLLVNILR